MRYEHLFPDLPDDARCWVYVADRPLTEAQRTDLLGQLRAFFTDWTSHGARVRGDAVLRDDRILLLAADVPGGDLSGCGIDKSVHAIEHAAQEHDFSWLSPLQVVWRDGDGQLQHGARSTFRALARDGGVDGMTPVIDLSVDTVGALRNGQFEQPAHQSWHGRVFRLAHPTA
ncbi:MAG: hypothetical protein GVY18_12615 [Bacteroidetes bacterium]|jgi:hypothetical protein|nr:hypothetical protein [Bacteroidota bacterium]